MRSSVRFYFSPNSVASCVYIILITSSNLFPWQTRPFIWWGCVILFFRCDFWPSIDVFTTFNGSVDLSLFHLFGWTCLVSSAQTSNVVPPVSSATALGLDNGYPNSERTQISQVGREVWNKMIPLKQNKKKNCPDNISCYISTRQFTLGLGNLKPWMEKCNYLRSPQPNIHDTISGQHNKDRFAIWSLLLDCGLCRTRTNVQSKTTS